MRLFDRVGFLRGVFDHHMREVVSGAVIAVIWRVLGAAAQFVIVVVIARFLGAGGLGLYTIAVLLCFIASTVSRIGFDQTLLRIMAVCAERGELAELKGIYRNGLVITMAAALAVTAVLFLAAPLLADIVFRHHDLAPLIRLLALSIIPFSLLNITATALQAVKKIQYSSIVQIGAVPLLNCLLLFLALSYGFGIKGAAWTYVISTVAALYVGIRLWNRAMPGLADVTARSPMPVGGLVTASMPNAWTAIMVVTMVQVDTLILGIFRPVDDVGMYNAALRLVSLAGFVLVSINMTIMPKFAAMYEAGNFEGIRRIAKHSTRLILFVVAPPLLLCMIAPDYIMLIFGSRFNGAGTTLVILAAGQLAYSAIGMAMQLLIMTRKETAVRNIMFASLFVNVALSFALAPVYGAKGVAMAHVVAYALSGLACQYAVKRHIGITTHLF
ncbi:MAG: flippase [Deltaproteobacteria bacterium]|nr:flippase [Deltaproteobacteria bacterium]